LEDGWRLGRTPTTTRPFRSCWSKQEAGDKIVGRWPLNAADELLAALKGKWVEFA
jgi:hypothetical protein